MFDGSGVLGSTFLGATGLGRGRRGRRLMRAARLHEIGGVPQIDEIDPPRGRGSSGSSVGALNPIDISIGNGRFYGGTPPMPYVIGSEVVGVAPDGRRVWVRGRELFAELADPEGRWVFEVPDGVADEDALGGGIAGLTAWLAVSWRAPVHARRHGARARRERDPRRRGRPGGEAARRRTRDRRRPPNRPGPGRRRRGLRPERRRRRLPAATLIVDALWGEPIERALAAAAQGVRVVHARASRPGRRRRSSRAGCAARWRRSSATRSSRMSPKTSPTTATASSASTSRDGRIAVDTETLSARRRSPRPGSARRPAARARRSSSRF